MYRTWRNKIYYFYKNKKCIVIQNTDASVLKFRDTNSVNKIQKMFKTVNKNVLSRRQVPILSVFTPPMLEFHDYTDIFLDI